MRGAGAGGGRHGTDSSTVPALVACLLRSAPHIVCAPHIQVNLHTCVQTYGYTHWGERAAAGTASSPLRVLRAGKLDGSPGLLRWRCCHGGVFPLQYVRASFMTHSFLTLGFISYADVYITNGVNIFCYEKDFMVMYSCIFYVWVCLLLCTWSEMT